MTRSLEEHDRIIDQLLEEIDELQRIVVALATTKRPNAGLSFIADRRYTGFKETELVEHLRKALKQRDEAASRGEATL